MSSTNGASIRVRAATTEEIPVLLDLLETVAGEGRWIGTEAPIDRSERATRWEATYFKGGSGCMFVAETAEGIVGSASVENDRGLVDLGMLVEQGHRGKGIGSKLLEACVDWSKGVGAHKVILQVWPHNEAAVRLYERFGFEREGYRRAHYRRRTGEIWDVVEMGLLLHEALEDTD